MLKKIIEFPFKVAAWLFQDVYGRVVAVILLALLACMVIYPIQDVEVGTWIVQDTLTEQYSKEVGGPSDIDERWKVDRTAIADEKVLERTALFNTAAYITLPFHHLGEVQVRPINDVDWVGTVQAPQTDIRVGSKVITTLKNGDSVHVVAQLDNWLGVFSPNGAPPDKQVSGWILAKDVASAPKPPAEAIAQGGRTAPDSAAAESTQPAASAAPGQPAPAVAGGPEQPQQQPPRERATAPNWAPSGHWTADHKNKIKLREVKWISRGLTLGLDLQGGTELVYKIKLPEDASPSEMVNAQDVAEVIRRRVDATGLKEPRIQPVGTDRILVQIPGFDLSDVSRIQSIITRIGRLEFRVVADPEHNQAVLKDADPQSRKAPPGWHWYTMEREDPKTGRITPESILISDEIELTGEEIASATAGPGGKTGSEVAVHVRFKDPQVFWAVTSRNVGRRLAIVLDDLRDKDGKLRELGHVHSAPVINEPILGAAEITGGFTQKTAEDLKYVLQSGSLKTPLVPESSQYVGPYQGLKAIQDGSNAAIIGFVAIIVFVLIYYMKGGVIADAALILNLVILVAFIAVRGITLTLPGIAGILLTLGMAVDANVLIFERVREERKKMADKPLLKCLRDGHSKALVVIIDSNVTTIITAILLYLFGSGPVKGFAVTLSYGLIISMFTSVVVTRIVFEALCKANLLKTMSMLQFVGTTNIPFVRTRKFWMSFSAVVTIAFIIYFFAGPGKRLGIEFSSGTLIEANVKEKTNAEQVRQKLADVGYKDAEVQEVSSLKGGAGARSSTSTFSIRLRTIPTLNLRSSGTADPARYPQFAGGAQVVVETDQEVVPKDMETRLADAGSPGCTVQTLPRPGNLFNYVVLNHDTIPGASSTLAANVETVFSSELLTGAVRRALKGPNDESLLVDEGVRQIAESGETLTVRVALKDPATPAAANTELTKAVANATVLPAEALLNGMTNQYNMIVPGGTLFRVRSSLKSAGIVTLEPFSRIDRFSASVASDLFRKAVIAVLLGVLAVMAYVWFRFEFRFSVGAAASTFHDIVVVMGALAIAGYELDLTAIAAILTVVGYSINDTIVIFDRIRENRKLIRKLSLAETINQSINQTLGRTLLTSCTVMLALVALFLWGGPAINGFAFAMIVGIVTGTYSSIFIASPFLLMMGEQGAVRGPLAASDVRTARPLDGFRTT